MMIKMLILLTILILGTAALCPEQVIMMIMVIMVIILSIIWSFGFDLGILITAALCPEQVIIVSLWC